MINGQQFRVRYIGINTPEINEYYYSEAKEANAALVSGKQVLLVKDTRETDQYDRLLRYVIVGDIFVNDYLVRQGFAYADDYPPDSACASYLDSSETTSRSSILGFWFPTPIPRFIPQPTSGGGSGSAVCSCSGNLYNCDHFSTQNEAQACFNYCISQGVGDIHRLDANSDGIACESLP
jgi:micrococcal nuclease